MPITRGLLFLALGLVLQVAADMNGMDMSMDGPMALAEGQMLPYLHFTAGDNLFFLGWVPKSSGAMAGACIALFLLGVIERWIAASRSLMEIHWSERAEAELKARQTAELSADSCEACGNDEKLEQGSKSVGSSKSFRHIFSSQNVAPFVPDRDIVRGIVFMGQVALGYAFMLAIMMFQGGFILSIALGVGFGEVLFGRFHAHALL